MPNAIIPRKSASAGTIPTTSIALGELCFNNNDGVLFTKANSGADRIVQCGGLSIDAGVTAGTNAQGQGALTKNMNVITTASSNPSGVTLPTPLVGQEFYVFNRGANPVNIYPPSGATINSLAVNTSIQVASGGWISFRSSAVTQFYSLNVGSGGGDALIASPLSQFALTTSAQLAGVISDETGTGNLVFAASPSLTTPAFAGETFSTSNAVTAGTNAQGQGALASDYNIITTAATNPSGVTLPTATQGRRIYIVNKGANPVNVYPATGATVNALAVNTAIPLAVDTAIVFNASSVTQWYSLASGPAYTESATAPTSPSSGDRWLNLATGVLATYVNDGTSSQWVELNSVPNTFQRNVIDYNTSILISQSYIIPGYAEVLDNATFEISNNSYLEVT